MKDNLKIVRKKENNSKVLSIEDLTPLLHIKCLVQNL